MLFPRGERHFVQPPDNKCRDYIYPVWVSKLFGGIWKFFLRYPNVLKVSEKWEGNLPIPIVSLCQAWILRLAKCSSLINENLCNSTSQSHCNWDRNHHQRREQKSLRRKKWWWPGRNKTHKKKQWKSLENIGDDLEETKTTKEPIKILRKHCWWPGENSEGQQPFSSLYLAWKIRFDDKISHANDCDDDDDKDEDEDEDEDDEVSKMSMPKMAMIVMMMT